MVYIQVFGIISSELRILIAIKGVLVMLSNLLACNRWSLIYTWPTFRLNIWHKYVCVSILIVILSLFLILVSFLIIWALILFIETYSMLTTLNLNKAWFWAITKWSFYYWLLFCISLLRESEWVSYRSLCPFVWNLHIRINSI